MFTSKVTSPSTYFKKTHTNRNNKLKQKKQSSQQLFCSKNNKMYNFSQKQSLETFARE